MKLASFNVNGIRARMHQLRTLVEKHQPDVIGLQEIKVQNELFPYEDVSDLGYQAQVHGQKGHYGVALLTRNPPERTLFGYPSDEIDAQRRMVGCTLDFKGQPLHIYNGYFPQGESRAHPEKFPNKRRFYADLDSHLRETHTPQEQVLVMGDMNISPTDLDIGIGEQNRKRWLRTGKCSFLPEEREWYQRLYEWGLTDAWRHLNPEERHIFSWFDYRSKGFDDDPRRGLRIDHILVTPPLLEMSKDVTIDYDIRAMDRPSDHCPVILELQ